jgi:transcriptional regulator with XRE-family HTH domain
MTCPHCHGMGQIPTRREIARQLRVLRARAGVTQVELARRLKLTAAHISQTESGRRPVSTRWLRRYAAVLGPAAR